MHGHGPDCECIGSGQGRASRVRQCPTESGRWNRPGNIPSCDGSRKSSSTTPSGARTLCKLPTIMSTVVAIPTRTGSAQRRVSPREKKKAGHDAQPGVSGVPRQESNLQPLAPEPVRSDNGPECIAQKISRWLSSASGGTLYIQKAGPWDHGYVERFNGRPRDELLNRELFLRPPEARYGLDAWRLECTHRRPHRGIRWQTPAAFAAAREDKTARQDGGWRR